MVAGSEDKDEMEEDETEEEERVGLRITSPKEWAKVKDDEV